VETEIRRQPVELGLHDAVDVKRAVRPQIHVEPARVGDFQERDEGLIWFPRTQGSLGGGVQPRAWSHSSARRMISQLKGTLAAV
jgi:hypothetical protein